MISDYYEKKIYKIGGARKDAILTFVIKENASILDIGCGDGSLGEILKRERAAKVYGVDVSGDSLEVAKNKMEQTYKIDLEKEEWPTELKSKKFDYIIITEVLEHLFEPEKLLTKIKDVANKDAEIIITVPNILFWRNRIKILFGNFDYKEEGLMDRGHIHFFSWRSFLQLLLQCGFVVVDVNNHVPTRGTKFIGKIFPGLFSFQFIIKARINE